MNLQPSCLLTAPRSDHLLRGGSRLDPTLNRDLKSVCRLCITHIRTEDSRAPYTYREGCHYLLQYHAAFRETARREERKDERVQ